MRGRKEGKREEDDGNNEVSEARSRSEVAKTRNRAEEERERERESPIRVDSVII